MSRGARGRNGRRKQAVADESDPLPPLNAMHSLATRTACVYRSTGSQWRIRERWAAPSGGPEPRPGPCAWRPPRGATRWDILKWGPSPEKMLFARNFPDVEPDPEEVAARARAPAAQTRPGRGSHTGGWCVQDKTRLGETLAHLAALVAPSSLPPPRLALHSGPKASCPRARSSRAPRCARRPTTRPCAGPRRGHADAGGRPHRACMAEAGMWADHETVCLPRHLWDRAKSRGLREPEPERALSTLRAATLPQHRLRARGDQAGSSPLARRAAALTPPLPGRSRCKTPRRGSRSATPSATHSLRSPAGSEPDAAAPPAGGAEAHGAAGGARAARRRGRARAVAPPAPPAATRPGLAAIPPPPVRRRPGGGGGARRAPLAPQAARRWPRAAARRGAVALARHLGGSQGGATLRGAVARHLGGSQGGATLAAGPGGGAQPRGARWGGAGSASARAAQEATRRAEAGQALGARVRRGRRRARLRRRARSDPRRRRTCATPAAPSPPPRAARSSTRRRLERKQAPFP